MNYSFPVGKLLPSATWGDRRPVVLVSCGSFNPITLGHLRMFEVAKDHIEDDGSCVVVGGVISPVNDAYGKKGLLDFPHRYEMCVAATESSEWISTDAWEGLQPEYVRTKFVLEHVHASIDAHYYSDGEPSTRISVRLLCGTDLFESFASPGVWQLPLLKLIFAEYGIVVIKRKGGIDVEEAMASTVLTHKDSPGVELCMSELAQHVTVVDIEVNEISSTMIRSKLAAGKSIKYLVPDHALRYILGNKLYAAK